MVKIQPSVTLAGKKGVDELRSEMRQEVLPMGNHLVHHSNLKSEVNQVNQNQSVT